MMRDGKFQMQQLKFVISRYHATSNILLCLKETNWSFPISKFPRTLQQENTQKRKTTPSPPFSVQLVAKKIEPAS